MDQETSKLSGPVSEEGKKKKTLANRIILIAEILIIAATAIVAVPLGIVLVRNYAFGDTFFVNGMSMYPTLNGDAYRNQNGTMRPMTWYDGNSRSGDYLDFGWGKRNPDAEDFYNGIHRYDVVMCHYSKDYVSVESRTLRSTASLKVKRIIGLPGETVRITYDPGLTDKMENFYGYTVWGETTITKPSGEQVTLRNLYSAEDYPTIVESSGYQRNYLATGNPVIPGSTPGASITHVTHLAADEYFVCGDNRRYSDDSRSVGAIKDFMIFGKACLVTGRRVYLPDADAEEQVKFRLDLIRLPWDYINLENPDSKSAEQ